MIYSSFMTELRWAVECIVRGVPGVTKIMKIRPFPLGEWGVSREFEDKTEFPFVSPVGRIREDFTTEIAYSLAYNFESQEGGKDYFK